MAKKTEIKEYLKKTGYTEEDMQRFFDECKEVNWFVQDCVKWGKNWSDLSISQISQLPTLKEKTLAVLEREKEEEKKVAEEAAKEKVDEPEDFETYAVRKIDAGESLSEGELIQLIDGYEVDSEEGESDRWDRPVKTIVYLKGRYFLIEWREGLTEMQENAYDNQPYEVEKIEETIVVPNWVRK